MTLSNNTQLTAEEYKDSLPKGRGGTAWTIKTYATYVNLLYRHITVPLNQEWKSNKSKLIHLCEKHGEYEAIPCHVLSTYIGCQCKGCKAEQDSASAGTKRTPRATQEEKHKAAQLRAEGKSYSEIGRIIGRSHTVIQRWLNPEFAQKQRQYTAKWRSENHEQARANQRRYISEFEHGRAGHCAAQALRRLQKQNTPELVFFDNDWHEVDRKETYRVFSEVLLPSDERKAIQELYMECQYQTETTGIEHNVDHIQPLAKGGEHLMINLQILTQAENCSKNDTFRKEDVELLCRRYFEIK